MYRKLFLAAAPLAITLSSQAPAAPVTSEDLRRHIAVLAGDDYEGRKPGTAGETKTLLYIATQMQKAGLQPAGDNGGWYQAVPIAERRPASHQASWTSKGRPLTFDQGDLVALGRDAVQAVSDAPVWFVGHGLAPQVAGADIRGAVALLLYDSPEVPGFPSYAERVRIVTQSGAAAVIGIIGDDVPWSAVTASYARGQNRLGTDETAPIQGAITLAAASALLSQTGESLEQLLNRDPGPAFKPSMLAPRLTLNVATEVRRYDSHNVIGRLPGRASPQQSVLYLAHWDHLGVCRPEDEADRVCNGAVDNASGVATIIEIAAHLAREPSRDRDILFMATTAEELGLLGAEYFAARPVVPLRSIVAAINADTVAVVPKGMPVAILGRGTTQLDATIDATARELGRIVDTDTEANAFIPRQDGWALTRAGVPAVMVGGSFSDLTKLGSFLEGPYHKPEDDLNRTLILDGAAEDADLMIALGLKLSSITAYQPPQP